MIPPVYLSMYHIKMYCTVISHKIWESTSSLGFMEAQNPYIFLTWYITHIIIILQRINAAHLLGNQRIRSQEYVYWDCQDRRKLTMESETDRAQTSNDKVVPMVAAQQSNFPPH